MLKHTKNNLIFIAFDLDDTLWDMRKTMLHIQTMQKGWLASRFPSVNVLLEDPDWIDPLRKKFTLKRKELGFNPLNFRKAILRETFQQCAISSSDTARALDELLTLIMVWRNRVTLYPGVSQTLDSLLAKYSLGVITNGNADINAMELGKYFIVNIRALDVGCEKPQAEIFQLAMQRAAATLNTDSSNLHCIYIGDDQVNDMYGASQIGWDAIWFNPRQMQWEVDMQQPLTTGDFATIPQLIDQLLLT